MNKIEKLKKKLYEEIDTHGRDSPRVLEISQKLDKYIVKYMKKKIIDRRGLGYEKNLRNR
jgi:hypothetical protein